MKIMNFLRRIKYALSACTDIEAQIEHPKTGLKVWGSFNTCTKKFKLTGSAGFIQFKTTGEFLSKVEKIL